MTAQEKTRKLEEVYARIQRDPLYRSTQMGEIFVPGHGSLDGPLLVFVGEAPGRDEERERRPFVGAAGKNLNSLLSGIGLSREEVFITNLVKYRPITPGGDNRGPSSAESRRGLPYLLDELDVLSPQLVVCLGLSSAKALLEDPGLKMGLANGTLFEKHGLRVLVTYHPSPFNYRAPSKRASLQDAFRRLGELRSSLTVE